MALKVDDFDPISSGDLRELWEFYADKRDRNALRLILEVVRGRRVLDKVRTEAQQAHTGRWEKNDAAVDRALHQLLDRLNAERERLGSYGGRVVKLTTDKQYATDHAKQFRGG